MHFVSGLLTGVLHGVNLINIPPEPPVVRATSAESNSSVLTEASRSRAARLSDPARGKLHCTRSNFRTDFDLVSESLEIYRSEVNELRSPYVTRSLGADWLSGCASQLVTMVTKDSSG